MLCYDCRDIAVFSSPDASDHLWFIPNPSQGYGLLGRAKKPENFVNKMKNKGGRKDTLQPREESDDSENSDADGEIWRAQLSHYPTLDLHTNAHVQVDSASVPLATQTPNWCAAAAA